MGYIILAGVSIFCMRSIPISASAKQWMTSQVQYIPIHLFFFGSSGKKNQVDFVPLLVNLLSTKGQYFSEWSISEHISQLQYIQIHIALQRSGFFYFWLVWKKSTNELPILFHCWSTCLHSNYFKGQKISELITSKEIFAKFCPSLLQKTKTNVCTCFYGHFLSLYLIKK